MPPGMCLTTRDLLCRAAQGFCSIRNAPIARRAVRFIAADWPQDTRNRAIRGRFSGNCWDESLEDKPLSWGIVMPVPPTFVISGPVADFIPALAATEICNVNAQPGGQSRDCEFH